MTDEEKDPKNRKMIPTRTNIVHITMFNHSKQMISDGRIHRSRPSRPLYGTLDLGMSSCFIVSRTI